jgi:hypothetical protein
MYPSLILQLRNFLWRLSFMHNLNRLILKLVPMII